MLQKDIVKICGSGENSLEIALMENRDFMITLSTFDTNTGKLSTTAQFPSPLNGGGNAEAYQKIKEIYYSLKIYQKSIH